MEHVIGLYRNADDAEVAIARLKEEGFDEGQIGVVAAERSIQERLGVDNVAKGASAGMISGASVGGLAGLLVGISAIVLPGIGAVLTAGAIATALASTAAGAGIGAAAGGLLGTLIGMGVPERDATEYAEGVKRGEILVTVEVDPEEVSHVESILSTTGAVDLETRHAENARGAGE